MKLHTTLVALFVPLLLLSACGAPAPAPGAWTSPAGANDIGEIYLIVSEDSTTVSGFALNPLGWTCGELPLEAGKVMFTAGDDDPYAVSEDLPGYLVGTLATVTEGKFSFSLDLFFYQESIFDIQDGTFTFSGEFSAADQAEGMWTLVLPTAGVNCSGEWSAQPEP